MATYDLIRELPVEIEGYELEGLEFQYSPEFSRLTTLIRLQGGGEEGVGEDVTYDGLDQVAFQSEGRSLPLAGSYTLESFFAHLDELELWPSPPVREPSILYRRWAFESAALDLALRQAGRSLPDVLGREARPLNFVVSMRLSPWNHEGPEKADRLLRVLEQYPGTRFKLDPTNSWTQELVDELAATGAVDTLDLKGFYRGTPVDVETDPDLYRMVAETFPDAYLEDPDVTDETKPILDRRGRPRDLGRPDPHDRRRGGAPLAAEDDQHQALAGRAAAGAVRALRLGRARGHTGLRRRPVRARTGPPPHPVPRLDLSSRHAERHRAGRLQRARAAGRPTRAHSSRASRPPVSDATRRTENACREIRHRPERADRARVRRRRSSTSPRPSTTRTRRSRGSPSSSTTRPSRSAATR